MPGYALECLDAILRSSRKPECGVIIHGKGSSSTLVARAHCNLVIMPFFNSIHLYLTSLPVNNLDLTYFFFSNASVHINSSQAWPDVVGQQITWQLRSSFTFFLYTHTVVRLRDSGLGQVRLVLNNGKGTSPGQIRTGQLMIRKLATSIVRPAARIAN